MLALLAAPALVGGDSLVLSNGGGEARPHSRHSVEDRASVYQGAMPAAVDGPVDPGPDSIKQQSEAPLAPDRLEGLFQAIGERKQIDPSLLKAIVQRESGGDPLAVSRTNSQGLMQLLPATARRFGVEDPFDPVQNLAGGADYLRFLLDRYGNRMSLALAAYNCGELAVDRHGGVPPYPETRRFVSRVLDSYVQQGGQVAPEDILQPIPPVKPRRADRECRLAGLRNRRQGGQERRYD